MIHVNISLLILDEILEEYGYIAVYIYNNIWEKIKPFKSIPINCINKFVELFYSTLNSDDIYKIKTNKILIEKCFPSINQLQIMIRRDFLMGKEMWFVKIILDMLIYYYSNVNAIIIDEELMPMIGKLITMMSELQIKVMNQNFNKISLNKSSKNFLIYIF